ncbi:hypothetical protein BpHYR1_035098 [Brachionus plicatilis]|uniref:Uncharacterized protein n=1 Tax=Brachionus plicatilis TaxID=10195 RepID=A0A3M7QI02_BRAPC|nr:hypothetical protein BpHYR1_035098 [Brachionus plicatilis]
MDETDYEEFPNKNTFILDSFRGVGQHSLDDKDNLALKLKVKENSKLKGVKKKISFDENFNIIQSVYVVTKFSLKPFNKSYKLKLKESSINKEI